MALHYEAHLPLVIRNPERNFSMMNLINVTWLLILASGAIWTTFFSLFNPPSIRGWRNLGWLACYILGLAMFVAVPWRIALATWALAGIVSALVYYCYGLYARWTSKPEDEVPWPAPMTIVHGLFIWPIMLPEAVEYWLADLGLLRSNAKQSDEA